MKNHIPISQQKVNGFEVAIKKAKEPLFEKRAKASIKRVTDTFGQRGTEYGDTWGDCQFLVMKAVARKLQCAIPENAFRALATAAFVDMKYQRFQGGYKDDSGIDGIAYTAYLLDEMIELLGGAE